LTFLGFENSGHELHQCGLAGTVGTDDRKKNTFFNPE